ncbi:MAG: RidA family protein [Leptospira sp.]|nr:RidA family protein [Leptospira sp.]
MTPSESIKNLGILIPEVPKALAIYVPSKRIGDTIYTSGQLPLVSGTLRKTGQLGSQISLEDGKKEAEQCVLNALATLLLHIPSLDEVSEIVKLGVFVSSTPDFTDHHLVANGASELISKIFGEKGRHSRFAIGVSSLPLGACVELEMVATVR